MTETDVILMAEAYRHLSQDLLPDGRRLYLNVQGVSLGAALRLAKLGHKIRKPPAFLKEHFFCIDVGRTTVFVNIPH